MTRGTQNSSSVWYAFQWQNMKHGIQTIWNYKTHCSTALQTLRNWHATVLTVSSIINPLALLSHTQTWFSQPESIDLCVVMSLCCAVLPLCDQKAGPHLSFSLFLLFCLFWLHTLSICLISSVHNYPRAKNSVTLNFTPSDVQCIFLSSTARFMLTRPLQGLCAIAHT